MLHCPSNQCRIHTDYFTNRLACFNRLQKSLKPAKTSGRTKTDVKRNLGRLKHFVDLPLDLIFEVAGYLDPLGVLYICRLTKQFRDVFLSRNARYVWRRVLESVPDLPPCPRDMSEPQFASLMFEYVCWACGAMRVHQAHLPLRVRFCNTCVKTYVVKGLKLQKEYGKIMQQIFPLVPRALTNSSLASYTHLTGASTMPASSNKDVNSELNGECDLYFKPEVELVLSRYLACLNDPDMLAGFLLDHRALASEMIDTGRQLILWEREQANAKNQEIHEITEQRRIKIEEKMEKLGWQSSYYPTVRQHEDGKKWIAFLMQPKEFTERGWLMIQPKMEEIYNRCKRLRLQEEFELMLEEQYVKFRDKLNHDIEPLMPRWADARKLVSLKDVLDRFDEIKYTEELWNNVLLDLLTESQVFKTKIQNDLIGLMNDSAANETYVVKALDRATSLFSCMCSVCTLQMNGIIPGPLMRYPHIVEHRLNLECNWSVNDGIVHEKECSKTAEFVLRELGLPLDVSREIIDDLQGRLVCLCGHPTCHDGPMSFESLTRHIHQEQSWYRRLKEKIRPAMDDMAMEDLHDDHDATTISERHLIAKLDDGQEVPRESTPQPMTDDRHFCRYCYKLTLLFEPVLLGVNYHMMAKHHKVFEDGDMMDEVSLRKTYGGII